MSMTRKQFLGTVIGGAAGAAVLAACGGDDGAGDSSIARNCAMNGTSVTIDANHGHTLTVSASDVATGAAKTYSLSCVGHTHMVTITAANFATLQSNANGSVMVTSTTTDAHQHSVTILCA